MSEQHTWELRPETPGRGHPLFLNDRFIGWITGWERERKTLTDALESSARRAIAGDQERADLDS